MLRLLTRLTLDVDVVDSRPDQVLTKPFTVNNIDVVMQQQLQQATAAAVAACAAWFTAHAFVPHHLLKQEVA